MLIRCCRPSTSYCRISQGLPAAARFSSSNTAIFGGFASRAKRQHAEWARLAGGKRWEFRAGWMSMSTQAAVDCDESILGDDNNNTHFDIKLLYEALLDPNRPIVAVCGSPGSGKSVLVAEYLHLLVKEGKRVVVICGSRESMYSAVRLYLKWNKIENFVHLQRYDSEIALRLAPNIVQKVQNVFNQEVRDQLEKRSLIGTLEEIKRKGSGGGGSERGMTVAEVLVSEEAKAQTQVVFATPEDMFELFATKEFAQNSQPLFDVVVLEDANLISEADSVRLIFPLAPLARLFGDPAHLANPIHFRSEITQQENDHFSLLERIDKEKKPFSFLLPLQYRATLDVQLWTARILYSESDDKFAKPRLFQKDYSMVDLLDGLVIDGSLQTGHFVMVDSGQLNGGWTEEMFKPTKWDIPGSAGGTSSTGFVNWGEAIIAAAHLNSMFLHGIKPSQAAFFAHISAHGEAVRRILFLFNPDLKSHYERVEIGRAEHYLGREFNSIVKSFVTDDELCRYFGSKQYLQYLSFELTRAKSQIFLIASMQRFRQLQIREVYEMIRVIKERGSVVRPSEILQLNPGQFEQIVDKVMNDERDNRQQQAENDGDQQKCRNRE